MKMHYFEPGTVICYPYIQDKSYYMEIRLILHNGKTLTIHNRGDKDRVQLIPDYRRYHELDLIKLRYKKKGIT